MQGLCHIEVLSIDTNMVRPKSGMFTQCWAVISLEHRLLTVADDAAWAI